MRKEDLQGLILHLRRGAKKHGAITPEYLEDVLNRHTVKVPMSELVNE